MILNLLRFRGPITALSYFGARRLLLPMVTHRAFINVIWAIIPVIIATPSTILRAWRFIGLTNYPAFVMTPLGSLLLSLIGKTKLLELFSLGLIPRLISTSLICVKLGKLFYSMFGSMIISGLYFYINAYFTPTIITPESIIQAPVETASWIISWYHYYFGLLGLSNVYDGFTGIKTLWSLFKYLSYDWYLHPSFSGLLLLCGDFAKGGIWWFLDSNITLAMHLYDCTYWLWHAKADLFEAVTHPFGMINLVYQHVKSFFGFEVMGLNAPSVHDFATLQVPDRTNLEFIKDAMNHLFDTLSYPMRFTVNNITNFIDWVRGTR